MSSSLLSWCVLLSLSFGFWVCVYFVLRAVGDLKSMESGREQEIEGGGGCDYFNPALVSGQTPSTMSLSPVGALPLPTDKMMIKLVPANTSLVGLQGATCPSPRRPRV